MMGMCKINSLVLRKVTSKSDLIMIDNLIGQFGKCFRACNNRNFVVLQKVTMLVESDRWDTI